MSEAVRPAEPGGGFERRWQATMLRERPLILPRRCYVYPRQAEEVERGALEVLVQPGAAAGAAAGVAARAAEPFLATCALGFADPLAPSGVWTTPHPDQLCAVAGGYAYLIDTAEPTRFEQVAYRPVLAVHAAVAERLLLFIGSRSVLAYGPAGRAWESPRLSDEGIQVGSVEGGLLRGTGWDLRTDREHAFRLDLRTGLPVLSV